MSADYSDHILENGGHSQRKPRLRAYLLTAMHLGRFKPGDKAPSVRRMAMMTGLSRKTIHRTYQRLAEEGLLELRWGSGTYFAETVRAGAEHPRVSSLLEAVDRIRVEADELGLSEEVFGRFLGNYLDPGLAVATLGVCECNREQLGLMEREIGRDLRVRIRPVLLADLKQQPARALAGISCIVTTDCHRDEVRQLVENLGVSVHRVALEQEFTRAIVRRAKQEPVLMVVSDRRYGGIFIRMLRQLGVEEQTIAKVRLVEPRHAIREAMRIGSRGTVYVSPLVRRESQAIRRYSLRGIRPGRYLSAASLDQLRAQLAIEVAASGARTPSQMPSAETGTAVLPR